MRQTTCSRTTVYHAAMHRNGLGKDRIKKSRPARMTESIDATLREREVDGFCEVERCARHFAKIWYEVSVNAHPSAPATVEVRGVL